MAVELHVPFAGLSTDTRMAKSQSVTANVSKMSAACDK